MRVLVAGDHGGELREAHARCVLVGRCDGCAQQGDEAVDELVVLDQVVAQVLAGERAGKDLVDEAVLDGSLSVFLAFGAQDLGKRGGGAHGGLLFMLDVGRASRALAMAKIGRAHV